jgi:geranylgeranyl diphosphate synthase type I
MKVARGARQHSQSAVNDGARYRVPVIDVTAGLKVLDIADFRSRVSATVTRVITEQTPLLHSVSADLDPMITSIAGLMAGGKRLRPAFAYWGYRAAGGNDSDQAVSAATSLEFLQACALIHDDVMDGSDTRRGLPATHRIFESLHRDAQWQGSAESFGVGAAILAGDLCLSWADELLFTSGMEHEALLRAKLIYDIMRTELMAGQYLDLLEQSRASANVDRIRNVIRYKSAKYTIERPLHMGAALAGASDETMSTLTAYGLPLGEAFQLRDDVLGVFGNPDETGKPSGDDLREGKRTALIGFTAEMSTDAPYVLERLGRSDLSDEEVAAMCRIITECGALARVEELIAEGRNAALAALESSSLTTDSIHVLANLAVAATDRKF